ncbi:hypothetical protein [Bradyrhizobium sp. USDA 4350]
MPIEHLRNLAKYGVITDIDPYDLAPEAFSAGVNVRFRNGKITGAPVFRNVLHLSNTSPRFVFASNPTAALDLLFVGNLDGTVHRISGTTESDVTTTAWTASAIDATWTSTTLADVTYVNRSDRSPWYLRTSDAKFLDLSSAGWSSAWQAQILRTCGGALVALNVTKTGTNYPTMVKTSSIPLAGTVPVSWDQTVANTLATENILADMSGGIVDACRLGSDLIIYGQNEAWRMTPSGQLSVFNYEPLPLQKGAINANCTLELDGTNVVFGPNDIWRHDGNSEKSLCDGKVRDYIYASINMKQAHRCFIVHNPKLTEISFCYVSGDGLVRFSGANGCNRAAVWNYGNDTWTFDDLPFVYSACQANLSNPVTYASVTATYDTLGGSYQDQEDGYKRTPCYVGEGNATFGLSASLYGFDLYGQGSTVAYAVDVNATSPKYLERDGIDLDEVAGVDLRDWKVLRSIFPQARLGSGAQPLMIDGGSGEAFGDTPVFIGYQPYDGVINTKCDFNVAGRYLSLHIQHADYRELTIAGLDFDFARSARRG